jgi:hypothetical protein
VVPKTAGAKATGNKAAAKRAAKSALRTAASTLAASRQAASRAERGKTQATVVKKLLKNMEEKLGGKDVKASLGDYIRLVQLQKELDEEAPREIKVTWVEPETRTTEREAEEISESGE